MYFYSYMYRKSKLVLHSWKRLSSVFTPSEHLWRSFFYVPGDQQQKINKMVNICNTSKIASLIPDIIVLDCEDAVSAANKNIARENIMSVFSNQHGDAFNNYRRHLNRSVAVRINSPSTGLAGDDIETVLSGCLQKMIINSGQWPGPDFIVIPKTESIDDLKWVEAKILQICSNHSLSFPPIAFIGMVESSHSLMNLKEIILSTKSKLTIPMAAFVFGSDDYCASLGVSHSTSGIETLFPRQLMVNMCKAYNLAAIDMVDTNLQDLAHFRESCNLSSQLGYMGRQLIHPNQIYPANTSYSPNPELTKWATELIQLASDSGSLDALDAGIFIFQGHMIDRPTVRQAKCIVKLSELINSQFTSP